MKHQLALAAILLSCATSAFAQQRGNFNGNGNNNRNGQNRNGATLPLPQGVERVISVDAYNTLLAESKDDDNNIIYTPIVVQHVYSGGIAALFGGTSIPTAQFVSPGTQAGGNFGSIGGGQFGSGGNGFQGNNGFQSNNGFQGGNSFQGNNGFNQGFNGNGFNQNGFTQGFNGNATFGVNGRGINNGFNSTGNGQIFQTPNGGFGTTQTSVVGPNGQQIPLANGPFFVR